MKTILGLGIGFFVGMKWQEFAGKNNGLPAYIQSNEPANPIKSNVPNNTKGIGSTSNLVM